MDVVAADCGETGFLEFHHLVLDTGGYVEAIDDPAKISAAVARVFDELQTQYMLAFEPAHSDGKYHEIQVTIRNRDVQVRARAGYVATDTQTRK